MYTIVGNHALSDVWMDGHRREDQTVLMNIEIAVEVNRRWDIHVKWLEKEKRVEAARKLNEPKRIAKLTNQINSLQSGIAIEDLSDDLKMKIIEELHLY